MRSAAEIRVGGGGTGVVSPRTFLTEYGREFHVQGKYHTLKTPRPNIGLQPTAAGVITCRCGWSRT